MEPPDWTSNENKQEGKREIEKPALTFPGRDKRNAKIHSLDGNAISHGAYGENKNIPW
jgi:hypothetical protein